MSSDTHFLTLSSFLSLFILIKILQKLKEEQIGKEAKIIKLTETVRTQSLEQETLSKTKKELLNRCFAWETRFETKSKEALHLDIKLKELTKKAEENAASNNGSSAQNAAITSLKETVETLKKSIAHLEEKLLDSDNDKAKAEAR